MPVPPGVSVLSLRRHPIGGAGSGDPLAIEGPVKLEAEASGRWHLSNGLLSARCGPAGLEQLWDGDGRPLLGGPLRWCRWRDSGEFWDAGDIAADHRDHPLAWTWETGAIVHAAGPLCGELIWRGQCGRSPVRLTLRLLAGSPVLEVLLSVQWRQRHELLQLEIPLERPQPRWAADTCAGVIERPSEPRTPREQARWEVTTLSWIACGELAVLLDGPQGVSAAAERLTVSLLRGPTWPDPGADNGWQRQRLGLMAAPGGWRPAQVPEQARRLREPLWLQPARAITGHHPGADQSAAPMGDATGAWPGFPALGPDLRLVSLRAAEPQGRTDAAGLGDRGAAEPAGEATDLILTVQNEGPCRRRLQLAAPWRVRQRLDGLDQPLDGEDGGDPLAMRPWQLGSWRIDRPRAPAGS
jgi:alpha-mannosidase